VWANPKTKATEMMDPAELVFTLSFIEFILVDALPMELVATEVK
jgi:hypothetical protein